MRALEWTYLGGSCGADWKDGFEAAEEPDSARANPLAAISWLEPEGGVEL